jgi:hypothetical protein
MPGHGWTQHNNPRGQTGLNPSINIDVDIVVEIDKTLTKRLAEYDRDHSSSNYTDAGNTSTHTAGQDLGECQLLADVRGHLRASSALPDSSEFRMPPFDFLRSVPGNNCLTGNICCNSGKLLPE